MKNKKIAWYLDEDVLLEGTVSKNKFYPNTDKCGFYIQKFDSNMIDKEIFFDLGKAFSVCGEVPVIRKEEFLIIFDHQIVAVNRQKAENVENSIVYRDDDRTLHTINLEDCAQNYLTEHPYITTNCIGERKVDERYFVFYTSGIKTKIIFDKKYVFQKLSSEANKFKLLTGERINRFHQFQKYLNETRYTTLDLS